MGVVELLILPSFQHACSWNPLADTAQRSDKDLGVSPSRSQLLKTQGSRPLMPTYSFETPQRVSRKVRPKFRDRYAATCSGKIKTGGTRTRYAQTFVPLIAFNPTSSGAAQGE